MKNLLDKIKSHSRFIISAVLIVIQLLIFGIVIYFLKERAFAAYWVLEAIAILVVLRIIYRNKSASYKISWIIFVLILPEVGILLYLIFGEYRVSKKTLAILDKINNN